MKYRLRVVSLIVGLFLLAQVIGLGLLYQDTNVAMIEQPGGGFSIVTVHPETAIGPRPELFGWETAVYMLSGVLIGTGLVFVFMRFQKFGLWRAMFFFAVFTALSVSLGVILPQALAIITALILAILKIFRPHVLVHNFTELFIYSGIALLFVPLLDVKTMFALLLIISAYDAFAVWKSRHMISLAKFQAKSSVFAGLTVDAGKSMGKAPSRNPERRGREPGSGQAILGGGDIAFPLLFAGTVFEWLVVSAHLDKFLAFWYALAIPIACSVVLLVLLMRGKPGHFYPAMPFLTAGALIGFGIIWMIL